MKHLLTLFAIVTLLFPLRGISQTKTAGDVPHIEVTGTAEKEIIPDEIFIAIAIRERQEGKEKITIDKQEAALKEALQGLGIALDNLSLSDANANYIRVKWTKKDVVTKNEYVLKVRDAATVGKVFEKLDELKIEDASVARVSHSEIEKFKREVRIMAITAAKEKAGYLLAAIGDERGKSLRVTESSVHLADESMLNVRGGQMSGGYRSSGLFGDGDKVIQFQKIKLQSAVTVKFEIIHK